MNLKKISLLIVLILSGLTVRANDQLLTAQESATWLAGWSVCTYLAGESAVTEMMTPARLKHQRAARLAATIIYGGLTAFGVNRMYKNFQNIKKQDQNYANAKQSNALLQEENSPNIKDEIPLGYDE